MIGHLPLPTNAIRLFSGLLFCVALSLFVVSGCSPNNADPDRELFELRCSRCHEIKNPLSRTKTPEGWRRTVWAMRQRGATVSDEEARRIVDYLSRIRGR